MSDDEDMKRLQADIDQIVADAKLVDPLAAVSAEEVEEMLKGWMTSVTSVLGRRAFRVL